MDIRTVHMLKRLNDGFYRRCAASFSQTRQCGWAGWEACLPYLRDASRALAPERDGGGAGKTVACGDGGHDGEPTARGGGEPTACGDSTVRETPDSHGVGGAEGASGGAASRSADGRKGLAVLDLACGNGRFEAFLAERLSDVQVRAHAVDNCDGLMARARSVAEFGRFDAIEALIAGEPWAGALGLGGGAAAEGDRSARRDAGNAGGLFDAAVSFGFFHHIPSAALREEALRQLLSLVRPGGIAIVSLWCFLEDGRLARKAESSHAQALREMGRLLEGAACGEAMLPVDCSGNAPLPAGCGGGISRQGGVAAAEDPHPDHPADGAPPSRLAAELEPGDRFLGWQDEPCLWRYCHSFDDAEADRLAAAVAPLAAEAARFRSDGKSGRLNSYLVFRKH